MRYDRETGKTYFDDVTAEEAGAAQAMKDALLNGVGAMDEANDAME